MADKVKVTVDVEFCSLCPFGKVTAAVWDSDLEEEVRDVICTKTGKTVYHDLSWYECAASCKMHETSVDTLPECCPFKKIEL